MKKIFVLLVCSLISLPAFAWTNSFMEKCLDSWIGYSINDVIDVWGYPSSQNEFAGRKVYIWEETDTGYIPQTSSTYSNYNRYGNNIYGNSTTNTYGGYFVTDFCNRTLEVDADNKVIRWQWKGNKCPSTYIMGKSWVNPQNDEWAVERAQKQAAKQAKKDAKKSAKEQVKKRVKAEKI